MGKVALGGNNPIRIQSMTTTPTADVGATVDQILRLADVGCDIARVTVQGMKEASACEQIKNGLIQKGCTIPLVADIHFFPAAALAVADFVDKVRINPGNFVDKRATFRVIQYDETSYQSELDRLAERFTPLVEKCKKRKCALRIGVNHGSLSDRILNRYGDTIEGMVESALEFTRVARALDFHDIVYSMKSSNPLVMVAAYRHLVDQMLKLGWDYPLHLGVTEAGEGMAGRVKSAIGIGMLLADGIGDTIRVSLTEPPEAEIEPARSLVLYAKNNENIIPIALDHDAQSFRIKTSPPLHPHGSLFVEVTDDEIQKEDFFSHLGCHLKNGLWTRQEASVDAVIAPNASLFSEQRLHKLQQMGIAVFRNLPHVTEDESLWPTVMAQNPPFVLLQPTCHHLSTARRFFTWLKKENVRVPSLLRFSQNLDCQDYVIFSAATLGGLLSDGMGEGIVLGSEIASLRERVQLGFEILQGARRRHVKTEYISCPGCGRTLFDLQRVAAEIRTKTDHLPNVKIAVMGCIVNGPGEMADADFGYVGSKPGKIDLYVGRACVERDIAIEQASDKLIALIKKHNRWIERP